MLLRRALFASALAVTGSTFGLVASATAAQAPSPAPTETGAILEFHTGPHLTVAQAEARAAQPLDVQSEECPDQYPSAYCTVDWIVSSGTTTSTFYYIDSDGELLNLPPNEQLCQYTTCGYENSGQGAGDIPYQWQITGNNLSITDITDQPPS